MYLKKPIQHESSMFSLSGFLISVTEESGHERVIRKIIIFSTLKILALGSFNIPNICSKWTRTSNAK